MKSATPGTRESAVAGTGGCSCRRGVRGRPGKNHIYRLYREEGLTVRRRRSGRRAIDTRAPILVEAKVNARWSLDFVHDYSRPGAIA